MALTLGFKQLIISWQGIVVTLPKFPGSVYAVHHEVQWTARHHHFGSMIWDHLAFFWRKYFPHMSNTSQLGHLFCTYADARTSWRESWSVPHWRKPYIHPRVVVVVLEIFPIAIHEGTVTVPHELYDDVSRWVVAEAWLWPKAMWVTDGPWVEGGASGLQDYFIT